MPKKVKNKKLEWNEKQIADLPVSALRILRVFVRSKREFLDSSDIKKILGGKGKTEGKKIGGAIAIFSKYQREPLVYPVLKIGRERRWVLNRRYLPLIKKVLKKVEPWLDK